MAENGSSVLPSNVSYPSLRFGKEKELQNEVPRSILEPL